MTNSIYDELYQKFITGDHISQMPLWQGAGLGLIVLVHDKAILSRIEAVQAQLQAGLDIPTVPLETAHITVRSFGLLVDPPPALHQLVPRDIPTIIDLLAPLLRDVPCFDICLARVGSFFVCPIVEAHDGGAILSIRERINPPLIEAGFLDAQYGSRGFIPHLTLAYYPQNGDGADARQTLAHLRHTHLGTLHVDRLALATAQMNGQLCCLETIRQFKLKESN